MRPFTLDIGWSGLLDRLGLSPADLLRAADLPPDLFQRQPPTLEHDGFMRLWDAFVTMLPDPAPGLVLGQSMDVEAFNPPLFAAFCSPNLDVALERLAKFKPLKGPVTLEVDRDPGRVTARIGSEAGLRLPDELVAAELVFLVSLARMATRTPVAPIAVAMARPPAAEGYAAYFGCPVNRAAGNSVTFSAEDARRPFLSVNPALFAVFEPELSLRLEELARDAALTDRLRAVLMEALPTGRTGVDVVARRLGLSARSLQRRLGELGTSYQAELTALRTRLATDYLARTAHSSAEISFLLGYSDPNSFIRAFHGWTGTTPEAMRQRQQGG